MIQSSRSINLLIFYREIEIRPKQLINASLILLSKLILTAIFINPMHVVVLFLK